MNLNKASLKHTFLSIYFTLYFYQETIDQYGIYYDRKHYRDLYENMQHFCLFQYRQLYPTNPRQTNYPATVSVHPRHLTLLKTFLFVYLLRGLAICLLDSTTNTFERRLCLGTELWKEETLYLETNLAFWTSIAFLFLHFSLTPSLLSYKFLALFRMTEKSPPYLGYSHFNLTLLDFQEFARFRENALLLFNYININMFILTPVVIGFGYYQTGLLLRNPLWSLFWLLVMCLWSAAICTIIYGNLIAFIVVVKYLYIKQKYISGQLEASLAKLPVNPPNWMGALLWRSRFLSLNTAYSHLYAEMADYLRFWSSYLSFVFVFYVLIITYMNYIILFSTMALLYKIAMFMGLLVHILLLSGIILYCGKIVALNSSLSNKASFLVGRNSSKRHPFNGLSAFYCLKVHNIAHHLEVNSTSGVTLLNGYIITHGTFTLLASNIVLYFILFIKN